MANKSELTKEQNLPGVQDELGKESIQEAKTNAELEIKHFKDNLVKIEEGKERFQKMWDRDDKLYHIMMSSPKKIVLTYEYEQSEEYWKIRTAQLFDKYEEDKYMAEAKLAQYDTQFLEVQEQLESTQELLSDLKGDE